MKYTDIQLADKQLWAQIQQAWASGDYGRVNTLVNNAQLKDKALDADTLNGLTSKIEETEELNDPDFAKDKMLLVRRLPAQGDTGRVYLEATNWYYNWGEVDNLRYTFEDVDSLGLTWAEADRGGW